ncbi:hypothetical protein KCU65_g2048, partial [Aureobasidium melanogenum]
MRSASESVITSIHRKPANSIYGKPADSKIVTRLDDLWDSHEPEYPPPYDLSTIPGAIDSEPTSQSDSRNTSSSRKRGKRRLASPVSQQTPLKRQLLVEKAASEPWALAFAAQAAQIAAQAAQISAQGAQIAALCAELQTLREEMQQSRTEAEQVSSLDFVSLSQASTVENSIEDRLQMVEDSILEEQILRALSDEKLENTDKQLALLDEKLENTNKQIRQELELECFGLQSAVENLESRHDDLGQEFKEDIDAKALDLQVKLEEFIEHRLEDVEEVVKHDVRMAFENASCKFKIDLGWSE